MMGGGGMMGHGAAMRFIFALMDSDGDGTVSLQEFQAAHEKIFKAMDTDKDGTLTLEEIQAFMRGAGKSAPKEHEHEHE
jgi:Ca2+-binding EF-hand superfamily protein